MIPKAESGIRFTYGIIYADPKRPTGPDILPILGVAADFTIWMLEMHSRALESMAKARQAFRPRLNHLPLQRPLILLSR